VPPLTDATTGASRPARQSNSEFRKNRGQIIAGIGQDLGDNTRLTASYYFSREPDYRSQSILGGITQDFNQKNFTVALRAHYILDSVGEILADGSVLNRGKETHQASLILTQLLSPTSVLRAGADAGRVQASKRSLSQARTPGHAGHRYRAASQPALPLRPSGRGLRNTCVPSMEPSS